MSRWMGRKRTNFYHGIMTYMRRPFLGLLTRTARSCYYANSIHLRAVVDVTKAITNELLTSPVTLCAVALKGNVVV